MYPFKKAFTRNRRRSLLRKPTIDQLEERRLLASLPIIDQFVLLRNQSHFVSLFLREDADFNGAISPNEVAPTYHFDGEVRSTSGVFHGGVDVSITRNANTVGGPVVPTGVGSSVAPFTVEVPATALTPGLNNLALIGTRSGSSLNPFTFFPFEVTLETAGPIADFASIATPRSSPVVEAIGTFSKPISTISFTTADVTLVRDGQNVPLTGVSVTSDGSAFKVSGLRSITSTPGDYVLTILNSGIQGTDGTIGQGSSSVAFHVDAFFTGPTLAGFPTLLSYTEGLTPPFLAPEGTVADPDTSSFAGAVLTVSVAANFEATDRVLVKNDGTGPGLVSSVGNVIGYEGVPIGTFTSAAALVITFNSSASLTAVQAVLRKVRFLSVSSNPSTLTRVLTTNLTDGTGGTSATITQSLTVVARNDAPVISAFDTAISYVENAAPLLIDSDAVVTDPDSADFAGGQLRVTISSATSADRIGIRNQGNASGSISILSKSVLFSGIPIGTFAGTSSLVVTFNASATPAAVQALVRNLTYFNTSDAPNTAARKINISISDGDGSTSIARNKTLRVVAVNDAPTITGITPVTYQRGGPAIRIAPSAVVADIDSANFELGRLTISTTSSVFTTDRYRIVNQGRGVGQIGVSGNLVTFSGISIGVISGGTGITPLRVDLNANATPLAVRSLLRNVTWLTTDKSLNTRAITISLTDGDGGSRSVRSGIVIT